MSKAALLIDWENFAGRVSGHPWWNADPVDLIPSMVAEIRDRCAAFDHQLEYKAYFHAAERPVSAHTAKTFHDLGFHTIQSGSAKNAADTRLIVQAIRLESEEYDWWYVVTGDEDFVDLGRAIEEHPPHQCFIWPVDDSNIRGTLRDYRSKEYVSDVLGLKPGRRPNVNEVDEFCICVQRLLDLGGHIGDWPKAEQQLAQKFELGGVERVNLLYSMTRGQKTVETKLLIRGKVKGRRRLKYEDVQLRTLLLAADRLLEVVERKHGTALRGDLISAIPAEQQKDLASLPDLLVKAGYLSVIGDDHFSFGTGDVAYGIVRPLRRMALILWHQTGLHPNWQCIGMKPLAEGWERQAARGRKNALPEERSAWFAEGRRMVKRAEACGLAIPADSAADGGRAHSGYQIVDSHPIVAETKEVVRFIWNLLPDDGSTIERNDLVPRMKEDPKAPKALGTRDSDCEFWLGAMASERIINLFDGKVQRGRNSAFRRWATTGKNTSTTVSRT